MSTQERLIIMILEDNPADVHLLKEALLRAEMNFTALVFEDGESAFRYIDGGDGPETSPILDAAILDLNVPKRNGSEVLTHIRSNLRLRHIPVVIFSSSPKHVMRDRAAQANCYITKPTDLNEFLRVGEQVRDCVEAVRAVRTSSTKLVRRKSTPGESTPNRLTKDRSSAPARIC
jgi:two-component system, chemotaxis family, response regulator Rcp1